ncbi:hypothetical protein BJ138DRAFT_1006932 [Hygrophoropsis aurantiaca]|uniref:Uncharacterized protein n=1 Tax=Hygrophoropsis aurantiaca TaxID=72124 RepID=A0ACB8ACQ1_9AGAM|nr:hypothetical protein BJ138DRAFT_1006932 [Hygrophoropsis aurantiaca]
MSAVFSLEGIPQEVLEHIAFFSATETIIGPPSGLVPLISCSRNIYRSLSNETNPHLYARIFEYKFDIHAAIRRLGPHITVAAVLSAELRKRFIYLKRIRAKSDSSRDLVDSGKSPETLSHLLWLAYLMMLENDGKNELQLREYARTESWLWEYWFARNGASLTADLIGRDLWPPDNEINALAMWLFWLLLKPDQYKRGGGDFRIVTTVLKLTALAANRYDICWPDWAHFVPPSQPTPSSSVSHYSDIYHLTPPPLATPAILSYLTFAIQLSIPARATDFKPRYAPPSIPSLAHSSEWEPDWQRCVNLGRAAYGSAFSGAYTPGSIEGIWEGMFTYTEFTAYAALLSGGAPPILHKSLVAQHRQTWKLREYHLMNPSENNNLGESLAPLSAGDPLRAYFPIGTRISDCSNAIEVREPGKPDVLRYARSASCGNATLSGQDFQRLKDIIILGEVHFPLPLLSLWCCRPLTIALQGHSAWGEFNLIGRIRPCDGFISLSKEYANRGKWLYRGFLVGNADGNLAGRWRDTLSPINVSGYEGCFVMSRRR